MGAYVPQELIDHIVGFAYNDHQTLCATRLVSRSWNNSARVHFFRQLDLLFPRARAMAYAGAESSCHLSVTKLEKFKRLLDILNSSPDIAYCVREVTIGNTTGSNPAQWNIYDHLLSNIVAQFKRFKQVTTIHIHLVDWSRISPSFITLLTASFNSPQLQYLDIWNCQVPSMQVLIEFLNSSCALAKLRLSHIRFVDDLDETKAALLPALCVMDKSNTPQWPNKSLQRLCIEKVPLAPILNVLLATTPRSIDITKLQRLSLHIDDIPSVRHFIQAAGGSLESLDIRSSAFQSQCSTVQGIIDLSQTPRLKYLHVSELLWTVGMCPTECLCPIFQDINNVHSLEFINIVTIARKRQTHEFDFAQWSPLDEILSKSVFSALQKVQIVVYSSAPFMPFSPSDADQLAKAFPRLQANRKIHVICK